MWLPKMRDQPGRRIVKAMRADRAEIAVEEDEGNHRQPDICLSFM